MDEGGGEPATQTQNNNTNKPHTNHSLPLPSFSYHVLHTGHCNKHACTCTVCMMLHQWWGGGEEEGCVCVCGTPARHGTVAGRQPKGQQHEQARCVSPSPSLFFSIGMDMQCQHKSHLLTRSRPLPPSFSLFSWLGTGGIHAEQLCSW